MKNVSTPKVYKKTRKKVIDKKKQVERSFKNYLKKEIAPQFYSSMFHSESQEYKYYVKRLSVGSVYDVLFEFEKNNFFLNQEEKSKKIIKISKLSYKENADKETRYLLSLIANNLLEDEFTCSALAWSCIHANRFEECGKYINKLILEYSFTGEKLDKLKSSLGSRLKIKDIDTYLLSCDTSNSVDKQLDKKIKYNDYIKLYEKAADKEVAELIYNKFKNNPELTSISDFILFDLKEILGFSDKSIVAVFIHTSKFFPDYELDLVKCAVEVCKNTMAMRSAFWAYQKVGDIQSSKECLDWLENNAYENNNKKLKEFVKKNRKAYLFLEDKDITELVESARKNKVLEYKANQNTMAYILHNSLPYASGGYATRGHGLATALQASEFDVHVITRPGFPLDTKKELKAHDITISQDIDMVHYHSILKPRRDKLSTFEYIVQASEELFNKLVDIKPSVIVAASNHLTAIPAMIVARKLDVPFIYEVRGFWEVTRISREPEFEKTEWYKKLCKFESLVANEADHVFTLTTPMLEELEKRGVNKGKITILPNSCNPEKFEPVGRNLDLGDKLNIPESVPVIGYIGTFVQYEGLEHLAEACGLLKQKGIEFRLLIVGNENTSGNDKGPITKHIQDVANQFSFEDWLIMPGRVPHEEVEAYYSLIDIAPFPRKPQPVTEMVSPMKPLEASAMKKAIVVSSVRALTDMIENDVNGLVFEKGNVVDFSEKLYQLVNDEKLRIQLGENARKWVEEERTWENTAKIFSDTFSKLKIY